jgi:DNA-directed RNA polymerase subunit RPC12/RpoP
MSRRTFWDEPRESVFRCAECGDRVPNPDEVGSESTCLKCGSDLHSCRNCTFFDTSAEKECRQPVPERIAKKRANNSCTFFKPVLAVDLQGGSKAASQTDEARRAWESLFK